MQFYMITPFLLTLLKKVYINILLNLNNIHLEQKSRIRLNFFDYYYELHFNILHKRNINK